MAYRASSVCPLDEETSFRVELDQVREAKDAYFTKEIIRWLLFATRPLSLTELRAVLQFTIKIEGLRFACPDDVEAFLTEHLSRTVEVRQIPASIAYASPVGHSGWRPEQRLHAAIASKAIKRAIKTLPRTHHLAFDVKNGHIKLAHTCLKYISMIGQVVDMSEEQKVQSCAEFSFMRYALDSFAVHATSAPRPTVKVFLSSAIFQATCVRAVAQTLLPYAAKKDDIELFDVLLSSIDPNAREGGWQSHTALSYASMHGNLAMVDILLSHPQINVDLTTHGDMTSLHLAISHEHYEVARLLMSKGNANPTLRESHGWNAIRLLFRTTGSKSVVWNHYSELTRTLDQIVLSSGYPNRYELHQRDLEGAAQSGNLAALHYMMDRYRPFIIDSSPSDTPNFSECEKVHDELFSDHKRSSGSMMSSVAKGRPCCVIQ